MLEEFTNQYPLSKTLRFELKPIGETAGYLEDFKSQHLKDFVNQDQIRAEDYQVIKEKIDDYHRAYIEKCLSAPVNVETGEMWITPEDFEDAYSHYQILKENQKDLNIRKTWEDTQAALRRKLVEAFINKADLFKKELITRDLPAWLKEKGEWEECRASVENFNKFTTYFSGFHENRKNMYTHEDQGTAIAYRLMNENLPRFFNNCNQYKHLTEKYSELKLQAGSTLLKKMGVAQLGEVFQPRYFMHLFAQSGIDNYQQLLGGKAEETGEKEQGLNEQINLFRQQVQKKAAELAKENNERSKKIYDLSGFTGLYKQILSDREATSFIPEAFNDDKHIFAALSEYIDSSTAQDGLLAKLEKAVARLKEADRQRVYIKSAGLRSISQSLFQSYGIVASALNYYAESKLKTKKQRNDYLTQKVFSLAELDSCVVSYIQSLEKDDPLHEKLGILNKPQSPVTGYLLKAISTINAEQEGMPHLSVEIAAVKQLFSLDELSKNRKAPTKDGDKGGKGFQQIQAIQKMLDGFMAISHAVKPLLLVDGRKPIDMPDMDSGFYDEFSEAYEAFTQPTIALYNKARNHLTKKPFSDDKIKINFGNPELLGGWDVNRESACSSVLLRKDNFYYLAIMAPSNRAFFKNVSQVEYNDHPDYYEKINYKQVADPGRDVQNLMVIDCKTVMKKGRKSSDGVNRKLEELKNAHLPQEINNIRKKRTYSKASDSFNSEHLTKFIEYYQKRVKEYYSFFSFDFHHPNKYADFSQFTNHINDQAYQLWYTSILERDIEEACFSEKIFLFQIYNKDFSAYSKGKPNLHTLYWKGLFEPENLKDVVLKLNGEAEIFYRKHSIKRSDIITHQANKAIENKNLQNNKKTSTFDYDIVKDRRYTQDKFQFHVPITLNFKAQGVTRFNDQVNKALQGNKNTHVIGIDRGERHLLYYTVISPTGSIVEQGTLNEIDTDQGYKVDYQQKLHTKEKEREAARKSWSSIENIKELKAGYLSHVIHKLAKLVIKYNAIVCLEDLNFGFKRGRFKVEKQVYQKFEKALIDKLNYLVFKDAKSGNAGHYLKAYQLTEPFKSFEKLGKQSGILFYVQAAYTSKIDPATGFIDFLKPRYESLAKSKTFFETIDGFHYRSDKNYFELSFDYKKIKPKQKMGSYPTKWTICTFGDLRYSNKRNDKGVWESHPINVTEELKTLLKDNGIDYQQGQDLKQPLALKKDTKFYRTLFRLLQLTLSLRHSVSGTDEDFILSPVADNNDQFFDSRNANQTQPKDADANGAYHIALKGIWALQKIRAHNWDEEKPKPLKLAMKNEDWLTFLADKLVEEEHKG